MVDSLKKLRGHLRDVGAESPFRHSARAANALMRRAKNGDDGATYIPCQVLRPPALCAARPALEAMVCGAGIHARMEQTLLTALWG
jgi:hypothetical protein